MTEREAFKELVKLSSHYARLLNQYDGGHRLTFKTPEEWIERLEHLEKTAGNCAECGKPHHSGLCKDQ